jgi:hypothetical protein
MALIKTKEKLSSSEVRRLKRESNKPLKLFGVYSKSDAKMFASNWSGRSAGYGFMGCQTAIEQVENGYALKLGGPRKDHVELVIAGWRDINGDEALKLLKKGKITLEDIKLDY